MTQKGSINVTQEQGAKGWVLLASNSPEFIDWFQALPCYPFLDGEYVTNSLSRRAASATFQIEFEDLGRVEIKVRMDSDLAHVNFTVQPSTREAIEFYLPRLRALLEDSGLTLGDVDVSTSDQGDETPGSALRPPEKHNAQGFNADSDAEESNSLHTMKARASRQIIDAFV